MPESSAIASNDTRLDATAGVIRRTAVLLYGLAAYAIGVGGLMWIILAMGSIAPVGISRVQSDSTLMALTVNGGLILLFGLQHSIMARSGFKRMMHRILPAATERSTFVLLSGVCLSLAIYFWQPLPGEVWAVENPAGRFTLWALYAAGWTYLFVATFITNHFELMGLRQVYLYFSRQPYTKLPFVRKYMYRYSRHPMMLGVLVGMWAVPVMSVTQLVMASLLTLYIAIGVYFEEKDLLAQFGEKYDAYRREIATLIPRIY